MWATAIQRSDHFPPGLLYVRQHGKKHPQGAGFCEWDASIIKTWRIKERFRLQVRGEVFNLANHGNYSAGSVGEDLSDFSSLGRASATPDVYASNPVVGSGGARHIQLGAKIIW